jgi:hypothetical protein
MGADDTFPPDEAVTGLLSKDVIVCFEENEEENKQQKK